MSARLLITRPRHQARALARRAQSEGWHAISLPLFTIEAVCSDEKRKAQLEAAADADWWVFTSTNAVSLTQAAAPDKWARAAAIGAATASALEAAGHPPEAVPEHSFSTEALLALPAFSDVTGQRIVIIGNEAPRETLRDLLSARGAAVESLPVYRLEAIDHSSETVGAHVAEADIAILTSVSAADRLWSLSDAAARRRLAEMPLVVPSERVADFCRARGLHGPHAVAQPMSNAALLAAADTLPIMQKNEHDAERGAQETAGATPETELPPAAQGASVEAAAPSKASTAAPEAGPSAAEPPAPPPAAEAPPPRRGGGWLIVLVILLLLAAAAAAGWWGWQQLQRIEAATVERVDSLQQTIAEQRAAIDAAQNRARGATQQASGLSEEVAALAEQTEAQSAKLREIESIVDAGRTQAHLVAVEQLLLGANERLQLGRDVAGARRALALADERLAALSDPRFFPVREIIAEEMSALRAVQKVDRAALALQLSALIKRSDALRLRGGVPDTTAPALPDDPSSTDTALPAWKRALNSVGDALASVFVVRRTDVPVKPLMAPEQDGLVRSVLLLRLEAGRAALMAGQQGTYEAALEDARRWLDAQYATEDAAVQAAMQELQDLHSETLMPALPDITGSLTRLREVASSVRGGS
ncbi:uroporphyrinogen-III C-methyltransferase [Algiphilus sp.]|uniref:uroporphyrinogen-III C-methyltransferase n=1 Tax=Algiphilus sp. TaxID=1872431 RepID=UPI003B5175A4